MNKPHKHAELIKAWADNPQLELQFRGAGCQSNCWYNMSPSNPDWSVSEVRIKPKTIKYRTVLMATITNTKYVSACNNPADVDIVVASNGFVRWLGDWQEVEV